MKRCLSQGHVQLSSPSTVVTMPTGGRTLLSESTHLCRPQQSTLALSLPSIKPDVLASPPSSCHEPGGPRFQRPGNEMCPQSHQQVSCYLIPRVSSRGNKRKKEKLDVIKQENEGDGAVPAKCCPLPPFGVGMRSRGWCAPIKCLATA